MPSWGKKGRYGGFFRVGVGGGARILARAKLMSAHSGEVQVRNRAAVAVAHTIIIVVYCMLRDGTHYQDLGPAYFDQRNRQAVVRRSIRRLARLGYTITLEVA